MLATGLQLTGTQVHHYLSALQAPGNLRRSSASSITTTMPRSQSEGPVTAVNMLTANCKVMRLHEKPAPPPQQIVQLQPKPVINSTASMFSVYASPPVSVTRASVDAFTSSAKAKKRLKSPHKPLLQKRKNNGSPARSSESSPIRRSVPSSVEGFSSSNNAVGGGEKKATKVFLSQKQSSSVKDCGVLVPCAPPATPTPEHLKLYDYVPSLSDIKAQRHMRQRLEGMSKSDLKRMERRREEQLKQEKLSYKEKLAEQKKRQRQEIYALNKVMTELEYRNFEELVKTKGLNTTA